MTSIAPHRPYIKPAVIGLALLGLFFSIVALYQHVVFTHGLATGPSFCNISKHINCDAVSASPWSVFLGLPIASYGLFFYTAILGLMVCSGPGRLVSPHKAHEVVLFLALLASLVSVVLLGISEFVIGALCLMCLGLYGTNFMLLGTCYWASAPGAFLSGFVGGLQNIVEFTLRAASGRSRAFIGMLALALCACISVLSPQVVLKFAKEVRALTGDTGKRQIDWVARWRASTEMAPRVVIDGGSFSDYAKGNPAAPIQIVEFADMECPGCREMYSTLTTLLEDFEGHYYLVFKNYPLDRACNPGFTEEFHLFACHAAYITRCAAEQKKFWEALDLMFTDQALTGDREPAEVKEALLANSISVLGLDGQAMRECVESARYRAKMQTDIEEGARLGLTSTPSLWINGKLLPEASREGLVQVFEAILAEKGIVRPSPKSSRQVGE